MKTLKFNTSLKPLLLVLLALSFVAVSAQPTNYMVMKKNGKKKRYTFIEGQEISYKVTGDIGYVTDNITRITDSTLEFMDVSIPLKNIESVRINKKKHFIVPNRAALTYATSVGISAAILEVAYLINTGKGIYDLGTQLAYVSTPIPTILLTNWIYSWFVKTEYEIAANEYQLYPIVLRKE
jgi:hypothetical protein